MDVLSLFDGISCGILALERAGVEVKKYHASEIDKYATKISEKNYPHVIRLGDITRWREWDIDFASIDLLLGGSPCQGFSFAGKQLNFSDERSKLFFVYVDILNHIKKLNPKVKFLLENVKMKKECVKVISRLLGCNPVEINSSLVSAQNRKRLYWANWKIEQPRDKGIMLKDIVHENIDIIDTNDFNINPSGKGMNGVVQALSNEKSKCLTTNNGEGQKLFVALSKYIVPFDKTLQIIEKEVERGKVGFFRKDSQANRVYYIHDKAVTLCGEAGGGAAKMGQYLFGCIEPVLRVPEATKKGFVDIKLGECVDLTFLSSKTRRGRRMKDKSNCLTAANYDFCLFGCITTDRIEKRQNGQRFDDGKKFYTLTAQDNHGVLIDGYIRKLTPVECERLQTLPDNYTKDNGISNAQRYKMLGNGWTVDVITHILKHINNSQENFISQGLLF